MVKDILNMFWFYSKTSLRARLQYKADAILSATGLFVRQASSIIVIYFTLLKFDKINGWNIDDMMNYPEIYMYITPLVGIVLYLLSYVFWRVSIRFYKSTGN